MFKTKTKVDPHLTLHKDLREEAVSMAASVAQAQAVTEAAAEATVLQALQALQVPQAVQAALQVAPTTLQQQIITETPPQLNQFKTTIYKIQLMEQEH